MEPDDPREPVASAPGADTTPAATAPATTASVPPVRTGTGVMPAVITSLVLALIVIIFVAQNTTRSEHSFLWLDFRTTPGVVALVALFLGAVGAVIVGAIVRRNRRVRLNEHEELARLRKS